MHINFKISPTNLYHAFIYTDLWYDSIDSKADNDNIIIWYQYTIHIYIYI